VRRSLLLGLTLATVAYVLLVAPAWAVTIQVTTSADENGTNAGHCSLREAVQSANINLPVGGCLAGEASVRDRIELAASTNGNAILLNAGTISVTSDVEIVGNGATQTIVDGGGSVQPFIVNGGATAVFQDLAIANGRAINGGAISSSGTLIVVNAAFTGNSATFGGAIFNTGGGLSTSSAAR
jgi:CSLREA domain-containing protein